MSTLLRLAADAMIVLHVGFIVFAIFGALLVFRWPRTAWLHGPCCLWAAAIIVLPWTCPLTTAEQALRARAGVESYEGGFIRHYLLPDGAGGSSETTSRLLAAALLAFNAGVYAVWLRRRRRAARPLDARAAYRMPTWPSTVRRLRLPPSPRPGSPRSSWATGLRSTRSRRTSSTSRGGSSASGFRGPPPCCASRRTGRRTARA